MPCTGIGSEKLKSRLFHGLSGLGGVWLNPLKDNSRIFLTIIGRLLAQVQPGGI